MISTTFAFTQKRILNLKPQNKTTAYSDGKNSNLKVIVTPRGKKTFYARFKAGGKPLQIKIGDVEYIRLDDAKARVVELINLHRIQEKKNTNSVFSSTFDKDKYTVDDAFNAYFKNHLSFKQRKGNRRHSLEINYTNHLKPILGNDDISELTKKRLPNILKGIGNQKGYAIHNKCVTVLKAMFNYCLDYEMDFPFEYNPALTLKKMPSVNRTRYLNKTEAKRLVKELQIIAHPIFTDLFMTALLTGARISNVKSMRWSEVQFEEALWIVPAIKTKTNQTYYLPLSEQALSILNRRYIENSGASDFVFPSSRKSATGHIMGGDSVWKEVIKRAGLYSSDRNLRIRQHDLRRTFATWQALNGVDINIISKTLGHSDIKNTQIYAQINVSKAREAINGVFDSFFKLI
ncbi:tyrosine-type recombinase/integrase [Paraglaciecola sp. MB-3u-78]|uniref:tyrosine-type recombinase/integrase n=1 Tax=Paraglaciecola sp. MB-3u-78 TaxID=2058332 RepID=UPI000C32CE52|nr:tyrosine-type recombinase/integrase [Paraglaciecola sp. MB-3u-78]PKH00897.1 site-specific integrase [Paraglaciecola sp. MB-3u-78]